MADFSEGIIESIEMLKQHQIEEGKQIMVSAPMPEPLAGMIARVGKIDNIDDAVQCAEDMSLLEEMLKHAHQYEKLAKDYCVLEAKMWIRIAGLDFFNNEESAYSSKSKIGTKNWRLVCWIKEKTDDELAQVMYLVSEGRRINTIRTDEERIARYMTKQDTYRLCAEKFVQEYKQTGKTKISAKRFYETWEGRGKPNAKSVNTWLLAARNEVLKAGGVGLGDGEGTYITVTNDECNRKQNAEAIANRLISIARDTERIAQICKESDIRVPPKILNDLRKSIELLKAAAK